MLKIIFDYQKFQFNQVGGISRYFSSLNYEFNNHSELESTIFCPYKCFPPKIDNNLFIKIRWIIKKQIIKTKNIRALKKYLENNKSVILHPTYYDPYIIKLGLPYILTVHDLTHEFFSHLFSFYDKTRHNKKIVIKHATAIIAVSNNTKKDIINYYNVNPSKIHVIPHASSISPKNKKRIFLPDEFLLYVGVRYAYKNFLNFVHAYSKVFEKNKSIFLVCAGGGKFTNREKKLLSSLGIQNNIINIQPSDKELSYCYTHALALIYPSLYEGFGLPIIEAFSCGCPVILSKASCFPEIAGDAGVYFDPNSVDSIYETINSFLINTKERTKFIKKGKIIARRFNWKETSEKTVDLYKSIFH